MPLIVDFYATWCGPCILMAQELEMVPWILITHLFYTFFISFASCVDSRMLTYFQTLAIGTGNVMVYDKVFLLSLVQYYCD